MKPMIVYTEIDNPIVKLAVAGDEQGFVASTS